MVWPVEGTSNRSGWIEWVHRWREGVVEVKRAMGASSCEARGHRNDWTFILSQMGAIGEFEVGTAVLSQDHSGAVLRTDCKEATVKSRETLGSRYCNLAGEGRGWAGVVVTKQERRGLHFGYVF